MSSLKSLTLATAIVAVIIALNLVLCGCARSGGLAKPDGVFPDAVGKYKLVNVEDGRNADYQNLKNKGQNYQTWRAKYSDGSSQMFYQVGVHKSAESAANELGSLTGCYDSNRKLQLYKTVWEGIPLKDRSGRALGAMSVCFTKTGTDSYSDDGLGDYEYAFALSNDNQTYTVKSLPDDAAQVANVTEFVKALPFNSGADLSTLDKFATARAGKSSTFKEMFDNLPPVKLAAKPYLKEKVLVLDRDGTALEKSTSVVNLTGSYIMESNRHGLLANDVGSIVRVDCKKGSKVGNYKAPEGEVLPAYAATCEVLIIDNTVPAVIASKTFKNEDMADFKFVRADKGGKVSLKEVVIPKPISEIKDFLQALPTN